LAALAYLYLFDGRGRNGARMIAAPAGFEHHDSPRMALVDLLAQKVDILMRGKIGHPEPAGESRDNFQGVPADGAGGTENCYVAWIVHQLGLSPLSGGAQLVQGTQIGSVYQGNRSCRADFCKGWSGVRRLLLIFSLIVGLFSLLPDAAPSQTQDRETKFRLAQALERGGDYERAATLYQELMGGDPRNPMGARAMYLGSTVYRIHGTNQPETIGEAVSSGCFRLANGDVIDLFSRVDVGAKVIIRQAAQL